MWGYFTGFPKGLNIGQKHPDYAGYNTSLKPAYEPILLANKPLEGTYLNNVEKYGVAGINIDGTRIPTEDTWKESTRKPSDSIGTFVTNERTTKQHELGRYPANLIIDEDFALALGERARFLFTPKPSVSEKEFGLDELEEKVLNRMNSGGLENEPRFAPVKRKNNHPTVKPIALNRYLATLIKPPHNNARLLVPFCGSGSEMIGALQAGWDEVVGIELDKEYCRLSEERLCNLIG
jgi:site-specific DNA-methyltransferase (adenine-specific)